MPRKIVKAEILFTRKCPLSCRYCRMKNYNIQEIGIDKIIKGLEVIKKLGGNFIAIYGAEPLVRFGDLLKYQEEVTKLGIDSTVITSGLGLTEYKWEALYKAGLRSITMSIDSLKGSFIDRATAQKAENAL